MPLDLFNGKPRDRKANRFTAVHCDSVHCASLRFTALHYAPRHAVFFTIIPPLTMNDILTSALYSLFPKTHQRTRFTQMKALRILAPPQATTPSSLPANWMPLYLAAGSWLTAQDIARPVLFLCVLPGILYDTYSCS